MNKAKQKILEKKGWKVSTVNPSTFLVGKTGRLCGMNLRFSPQCFFDFALFGVVVCSYFRDCLTRIKSLSN